jgi:hypothetical protein
LLCTFGDSILQPRLQLLVGKNHIWPVKHDRSTSNAPAEGQRVNREESH